MSFNARLRRVLGAWKGQEKNPYFTTQQQGKKKKGATALIFLLILTAAIGLSVYTLLHRQITEIVVAGQQYLPASDIEDVVEAALNERGPLGIPKKYALFSRFSSLVHDVQDARFTIEQVDRQANVLTLTIREHFYVAAVQQDDGSYRLVTDTGDGSVLVAADTLPDIPRLSGPVDARAIAYVRSWQTLAREQGNTQPVFLALDTETKGAWGTLLWQGKTLLLDVSSDPQKDYEHAATYIAIAPEQILDLRFPQRIYLR